MHLIRAVLIVAMVGLGCTGPAMAQVSFEVLDKAQDEGEGAAPALVEADEPPPICGNNPITIARMQWPSASLLAEIHARILTLEYGCDVRVLPGDMAATASSMGNSGQPGIAPEMWLSRIADVWNPAMKAQKVRRAGISYQETAFEGWYIPDYMAAAHPDLVSAAQLKEQSALFSVNNAKPKFISCPPDWGCAVINRNLLRAFGLDGLFDVVEPANRFEFDALIAEGVSRRDPLLFYYWSPNAVLYQFGFKALDLGAYDAEAYKCLGRAACAVPQPTSFPPEQVVIAAAEWVFTDTPQIAAYLSRAAMPMEEMNRLLAELNAGGTTIEQVADRFVAERQSVWGPWAGLPVEPEAVPATDAAAQ